MRFSRQYFDAVASGAKTTTVRWREMIAPGPAIFVFEDHPANPTLRGEVTAVQTFRLDDMTATQAGRSSDDDLAALKTGLRGHYPEMPDDAEVHVVAFRVLPES